MNVVDFYRNIYRDNGARAQRRRSLTKDLRLYAKNRALRPLETALTRSFRDAQRPLVFILGVPRSGTTLLYQLMVRHLRVGYVSNAAARYWMAPVYGTWRTATPRNPANRDFALSSSLGSSEGVHGPHEFSYFWHFWSGFFDTDDLTEAELDTIQWSSIRRELHALAGYFDAPLVLKALNHGNYNASRFHAELSPARFVLITRDERYVCQSILKSRNERYGSEDEWWSLRPRDVARWAGRPVVEQVCHQVRDVSRGIESSLSKVPQAHVLRLEYESLVTDPVDAMRRVGHHIDAGEPVDVERLESTKLPSGNRWRVPKARQEEIERCLNQQD